MLINESTAVSTSKVLLVPYSKHHVSKYHEWMKDPEIQEATASEPLTLEQEYAMQSSWRQDTDKLTFIICQPAADLINNATAIAAGVHDADEALIGDVNMFITTDTEEEDGSITLAGELELMIATKAHQGQGLGRSALLTFLHYIAEHEEDIIEEILSAEERCCKIQRLLYYSVKIGQQNHRSIGLFESLGFVKTSTEPSYFGEFEWRCETFSLEAIKMLLEQYKVDGYTEMTYESNHGA